MMDGRCELHTVFEGLFVFSFVNRNTRFKKQYTVHCNKCIIEH